MHLANSSSHVHQKQDLIFKSNISYHCKIIASSFILQASSKHMILNTQALSVIMFIYRLRFTLISLQNHGDQLLPYPSRQIDPCKRIVS
jgi:hypothetical protein